MGVLVITSCTGRKKYKSPNQLKYEDFASSERLQRRTVELKDFKTPASEMYTGQQHQHLIAGLEAVREVYGSAIVDFHIISAGYGLLAENDVIVPYNVTFSGLNKRDLLARSNSLQLHERVETLIANYDLVFFLLGKEYVQALRLPFEVPNTVTQIFLLGDTHRKLIPDLSNIYFISAGKSLAREFNTTCTTLKGLAFRKLCEVLCCKGFHVFKQIEQNPQRLVEILHNQ